ncbi:recombinase family protein (plasmid) [Embleya sp. NBC_00888]|uniref:recombinase family protein n=1 Tax=Embleya sp. NBC_00888 TaxID=2975960 RepID=UPI002F915F47|nr:recombinase family protein [Embleya sp. NBC_00888]
MPRPADAGTAPVGHIRLGYARASTARQSLDTQLDSFAEAGVTRVFSEKISTRATRRPELDKAVGLARELRASGTRVTLVVHEHKRLGRGLDLAALAEDLKASDVGLEFLTGELQGSHDPSGVVFTVLAALSGVEREYIRDRTLEGQESARRRGKTIGGAGVADDHMVSMAVHLREQGMSLRDIVQKTVLPEFLSTSTSDTVLWAWSGADPGLGERWNRGWRQALTDVMDAVDGGRSRRLPVLVRFGVGEGAVSAEISGWARTSPRCTTRTGPGAISGC